MASESKRQMHGVARPGMGQLEVQQMLSVGRRIAASPQRYPRGGVAAQIPPGIGGSRLCDSAMPQP